MASFAKNWWEKHEMDRDGKGCCLIATLILLFVFLAGAVGVGTVLYIIFT
jgi:hypothetical protein